MDVLGEILTTLELSSRLWFRAELSVPFSVAVPEEAGTIRFHVVRDGPCSIAIGGGPSLGFAPGDLVMVPHGAAHVLADEPGRTPCSLAAVLDEARYDGGGTLVHGAGGASTVVVCGEFRFGQPVQHPFLASLPPLLHVPADGATGYAWVEQVLAHIEHEARAQATGYRGIVRRLSEILLIEVLRAHAEPGQLAALSALVDPQLGRALEAMHARPEEEWSLAALARVAGQSRTLFAERFRERMGVPPMKYLASWRMQKARGLLARADAPLADVARRVGYASESAFNRAFREHFGAPPGAYRRRAASVGDVH